MNSYEIKQAAKKACIEGINMYMQNIRNIETMDGETKRRIIDEMGKISQDIHIDKVDKLKHEKMALQSKLDHILSLDDCNEEFEM